jgi:hypothetical protein
VYEHFSVVTVRDRLKLDHPVSRTEAESLADLLPHKWQQLIADYGYAKVFACLRDDRTLGGALYVLRSRDRLQR